MGKGSEKQRFRGGDRKMGIGRVRVKGVWRAWADIEKEELQGERGEDRGEREEKEGCGRSQGERNF